MLHSCLLLLFPVSTSRSIFPPPSEAVLITGILLSFAWVWRCLFSFLLITLPATCVIVLVNTLTNVTTKEGFILTHGCKIDFTVVGTSWQQEFKASSHTTSPFRKQRKMNIVHAQLAFFLLPSRIQCCGIVPLFKAGCQTSFNPIEIIPHNCGQNLIISMKFLTSILRGLSQMIPNSVNLAVNSDHHNPQLLHISYK